MKSSLRLLSVVVFAVLAFASSSLGCASKSPCDSAGDHAKECLPDQQLPPGVMPSDSSGGQKPECSGAALCMADCLNASSCDDLKAAFAGQQSSFGTCAQKCQ